MSDKEKFGWFVALFRATFLGPDEPWSFLESWWANIGGFSCAELQYAVQQTSTDIRVVKTPARFYGPIILDWASEIANKNRTIREQERRRVEDGKIKPASAEQWDFAMRKVGAITEEEFRRRERARKDRP